MDVYDAARELYRSSSIGIRLLQSLRPYICPFDELIARVPAGSSVLDIGCGAGLFLGLLEKSGRLARGVGFDASHRAVVAAQAMSKQNFPNGRVQFEFREPKQSWPSGSFDVVSMIDVMHHVPPPDQRTMIDEALSRVNPGGFFLYKDMVDQPAWRAHWNRAHDLILARQWIHYRPLEDVLEWTRAAGFEIADQSSFNQLAYGHELILAQRPH
jgi:2-polyprenyl-3-methyl-5-hydroxy-6-metoxy-1,4-benzoquinol methylase